MSRAQPTAPASPPGRDADDLAEHGCVQRLDRSIGRFSSLAAGVSCISIPTGAFQLIYLGYSGAGPIFVLSWPLVFVGQLLLALCFAELAARFPVAGSVCNWTKKLASPTTAWMAGWLMLTASVVSMAAVTLACQLVLPNGLGAALPVLHRRGDRCAGRRDPARQRVGLLWCRLRLRSVGPVLAEHAVSATP